MYSFGVFFFFQSALLILVSRQRSRNEAAGALWHKLRKLESSQSLYHLDKNFSIKNREKGGTRGHLVSIKKIKWFTLRILQTALLLGRRPCCSLHHHPVDTTVKASNGRADFLNQKLIVPDMGGGLTLSTLLVCVHQR